MSLVPRNPTKKLTHLVNFLGHLFSLNRVSNFSDLGPPPPPPPPPILGNIVTWHVKHMTITRYHPQMEDQQKAEQQKTESKTVREKLKVQNEAVAGRTEQVMKDLAEVEPAVRDAENGPYQKIISNPITEGLNTA